MTPLSVYVHIPFCTIKCGYCDFNAYAGMDALKGDYQAALLAEIQACAETLAAHEVVSIGFGGGTPGESPAGHIGGVIQAIRTHGTLADDAEVTLEANPGTSTPAYLAALREAGVNRISLGAQSFDPAHLGFLDRIHSVEAIGASVRAARAARFESVNLDLIYGLPDQSLDHWRGQLQQALALRPDHLSLYALTVEEGTILHKRVESGAVTMPDGDLVADMYDLASEILGDAGFHHYELSNWALPGHESRHNLAYWTDRDYLGVGAGAHGYLGGRRYENAAHPRDYIRAALNQTSILASSPSPAGRERGPGGEGSPPRHAPSAPSDAAPEEAARSDPPASSPSPAGRERGPGGEGSSPRHAPSALSDAAPEEAARSVPPASSPSPAGRERGPGGEGLAHFHDDPLETTIADWTALRLRLVDGFDPAAFRERFGIDIEAVLAEPLRAAVQAGWLEWGASTIRLTPRGRLLHAELAVRLIDHLERHPLVSPSRARR